MIDEEKKEKRKNSIIKLLRKALKLKNLNDDNINSFFEEVKKVKNKDLSSEFEKVIPLLEKLIGFEEAFEIKQINLRHEKNSDTNKNAVLRLIKLLLKERKIENSDIESVTLKKEILDTLLELEDRPDVVIPLDRVVVIDLLQVDEEEFRDIALEFKNKNMFIYITESIYLVIEVFN